jgi:ubiquinone/menaquinone biosynthesis C-methylase UbiE
MTLPINTYDEQSAIWNGAAGHTWAAEQDLLDQMFKPLEEALTELVWTLSPHALLDVGCGTGATTLAAARLRRQDATIVGIDVSEPMIAVARGRAKAEDSPAQFICADAETFAFEDGICDLVISRLGVMFFADPVAAFSNLRRAAADDAQLRMIAFRSADQNPFMTTAERAAQPLLPTLPARVAGPGQFAFADADFVETILCRSGWQSMGTEPIDLECTFPASELTRYFTRLGPVGRVLAHVSEPARGAVIDAVHSAFQPYVEHDQVRFTAALWMIAARAGRRRKDQHVG